MSDTQTKLCILCNYDPATMGWFEEDCCAECFWARDAEEKKVKRSNPQWRFQAAYSAAKVLFNKSDKEAIEIARKKIENPQ